jgi:hypothetical protein
MYKMILKSSVVLWVLVLLLPTAVGQQVILEPTDHEVALAGTLELVHGFGPPGYGEDKKNDRKIVYWVVKLQTPVNTPCTPERPEWADTDCASTNRLRLFLPLPPQGKNLEAEAQRLRGHKVIATGILHRRETMGEITPIYMNVTDLVLAKT